LTLAPQKPRLLARRVEAIAATIWTPHLIQVCPALSSGAHVDPTVAHRARVRPEAVLTMSRTWRAHP